MRLIDDEMAVCADCLCEIANGDSTRLQNLQPGMPYFDARSADLLAEAAVADRLGYWVPDADDFDGEFSESPCDRCGDPLHGDRYAAAILGGVS